MEIRLLGNWSKTLRVPGSLRDIAVSLYAICVANIDHRATGFLRIPLCRHICVVLPQRYNLQ